MPKIQALLLAALILVLAGCGYGFRGTVSYLPREIKTVAVPYPSNSTGEIGLEVTVANALIKEFNRSKLLRLAEMGRADVVLKGRIKSLTTGAVAFEDIRTAVQRRINISLDLQLVRVGDQRVMWQNRDFNEFQDYDVAADGSATEANREKALEELAKNVAEKVHDAIFENF